MGTDREEWGELQRNHHINPERGRFEWQTTDPFICQKERELLAPIAEGEAKLALEIGCGEGANIVNLRSLGWRAEIVGLDFSVGKVRFAHAQQIANSHFGVGDALSLPFGEETFDLVFCRDLLHHVRDRFQAVREMIRVCRPGGRLLIIEGNGKKWTNRLFALVEPAERGMRESSPVKIEGMLRRLEEHSLRLIDLHTVEPTNLFRVLLHHRYGFSTLSHRGWVRKTLKVFDRIQKGWVPKRSGAYIVAMAQKEAE